METLTTKRLVLKAPTLADVLEITEQIGNWNVARMLARVPYPYVQTDCERWIAYISERNAAGHDMAYAIHREGLIGVVAVEEFDGIPVFGYWLAEAAWGQGFATEASVAVLRRAFDCHVISEIRSSVFRDNQASLNVQMKLGFEETQVGSTFCLSRNAEVKCLKTILTRNGFERAGHMRPA